MRNDGGGGDIDIRRDECGIDLGGQYCDAPREYLVMFALSPRSFANRCRPLTCTFLFRPPHYTDYFKHIKTLHHNTIEE